jgi:ribosomal protein L11 methylase PrmA
MARRPQPGTSESASVLYIATRHRARDPVAQFLRADHGKHVGDPFSGGGTTLVEGARLGAAVTGTDVDPLAVRIARDELSVASDAAVPQADPARDSSPSRELGLPKPP